MSHFYFALSLECLVSRNLSTLLKHYVASLLIISIISILLSLNLYLHFRVLVRHVDQNPNVVTLGGFGNNGVEELKESLEDDSVMYGLGKRAVEGACIL